MLFLLVVLLALLLSSASSQPTFTIYTDASCSKASTGTAADLLTFVITHPPYNVVCQQCFTGSRCSGGQSSNTPRQRQHHCSPPAHRL